MPVGVIGTDPEDLNHTEHVNDLLHDRHMTSDHVVRKVEELVRHREFWATPR